MTDVLPALIILPRETGDVAALVQVIVDATNDYTQHGRIGKYEPYVLPPRWKVTAPTWNIRDKPMVLGSKILGQLKAGEAVSEVEIGQDRNWIHHDGGLMLKPGWSHKSGLEKIA